MGKIEVILGSMYAEKSTELIRRVRRYKIAGKKVIAFKHTLDCKRNNTDAVITHNRVELEAIPVESISGMYDVIRDKNIDVIAIDEAQFFDKDIVNFSKMMSRVYDKRLIIAGLDMDYQGDSFGYMGDLCCIADEILKLHAVCAKCGLDAKYSYRKTNDENIISIGANDKYEALCEKCYKEKVGLK